MNDPHGWYTVAAILGTVGLWLLLPPGHGRRRWLGAVPLAAAGGMILGQSPWLQSWAAEIVFGSMALVALVGAVGTIAARQPVYCAVWFALSLAGTAGLMLVNWAELLAVAILIVYAGAILVMFLFVLMLSQPDGRAAHDRNGWEPLVSAATGAVLVGVLTMNVAAAITQSHGQSDSGGESLPSASRLNKEAAAAAARTDETTIKPDRRAAGPADPTNPPADAFRVGRLGAELFSRHLVAVEVAGVLLLVALVAAAVIIGPARRRNPG